MDWWLMESTLGKSCIYAPNGRIEAAAPLFDTWIGESLWRLCRAYQGTLKPLASVQEGEAITGYRMES